MENLTKVCSRCKAKRVIDEFYKNSSRKDGLSVYCKICSSEINKRWYKENPEKVKEKNARWCKENPEKVKEKKVRYSLKKIKELPDSYIRQLIKKQGRNELANNPEIIEIKRLTIQIHRLCKTVSN